MVNSRTTRRQALKMMGGAAAAGVLATRGVASALAQQVTPGKFTDQRASLESYRIPEWFADAKFGIWAHWGPQSAVGGGGAQTRDTVRCERTPIE